MPTKWENVSISHLQIVTKHKQIKLKSNTWFPLTFNFLSGSWHIIGGNTAISFRPKLRWVSWVNRANSLGNPQIWLWWQLSTSNSWKLQTSSGSRVSLFLDKSSSDKSDKSTPESAIARFGYTCEISLQHQYCLHCAELKDILAFVPLTFSPILCRSRVPCKSACSMRDSSSMVE